MALLHAGMASPDVFFCQQRFPNAAQLFSQGLAAARLQVCSINSAGMAPCAISMATLRLQICSFS